MKWFYALLLILITLHSLQAEDSSSEEDSWSKSLNSLLESFTSDFLRQLPLWATEIKELSAQPPLPPDATMLQETPQKLLQQAIQRQENYRENSLKTGHLALLKEELIRAEQESQACYQLFLQAKNYSHAALCLVERGNSLNKRQRPPDAKEHYQKALELAETHHLTLPKAKALNGLARLAVDEKSDKSMAEAEQHVQQAEQLCEELKDYDCWVMALDQLAGIQRSQGNLNAAMRTANKTLVLANKTSHPMRELMFAYLTRCDVYGQFDSGSIKAQNDLEQAITLAKKQGYEGFVDKHLLPELKATIGMRNLDEQKNKTGEQYMVGTKDPNNRTFHPQYPKDVNVMKNFISSRGDLTPTEQHLLKNFDKARAIFNTTETIAPSMHFSSIPEKFISQGRRHELEGKYDLAFEDYSKAIELLENDRSDLTGTSREVLLATAERQGIYLKATLYLLQQKRNSEAFTFMERARARYTADLVVSGRKAEWITPQERFLFAQLQETLAQMAKLQKGIVNSDENPSKEKALLKKLEPLESQYQKILEDISHQAPHLHTLLEAQPASLEALQADMRTHQYEVLYYLIEPSQIIVWHISTDQVLVRSIFLFEELLNEKIKQLHASFKVHGSLPPFDENMAHQLFLFLIQPVLSQIKAKHLVIIPHKDLYFLPFQILLSPQNQYLGELYTISYAPSATLLLELNKLNKLKGANLLAVLDPRFKGNKDDVTTIQPLFASKTSQVVLDKPGFDKSQLLNMLNARTYQVVHLSLHGQFNNDDPMLSSLTLPNQSLLTAAEMFALPLKHTQLVTLSACEMGQVGITRGHDILGMQRALLYAGTQAMILPMWKIDAEATAAWMKQFYQAAQTVSLPEAAQRASLALKTSKEKDWSHPFYWGGFQLVGK